MGTLCELHVHILYTTYISGSIQVWIALYSQLGVLVSHMLWWCFVMLYLSQCKCVGYLPFLLTPVLNTNGCHCTWCRNSSHAGNQQGPKPHQQEAQPSRGGQQSGRNTGEQSKIQPYHDSGRRPAEPHIPDDRYSLTPAEQPPGIRPGPQPRRPEGRKSAWATLPPPTGATPTPLVPTLPVPTPPVPTSSTRTQPPGPPHYTPTTDSPLNGKLQYYCVLQDHK